MVESANTSSEEDTGLGVCEDVSACKERKFLFFDGVLRPKLVANRSNQDHVVRVDPGPDPLLVKRTRVITSGRRVLQKIADGRKLQTFLDAGQEKAK